MDIDTLDLFVRTIVGLIFVAINVAALILVLIAAAPAWVVVVLVINGGAFGAVTLQTLKQFEW